MYTIYSDGILIYHPAAPSAGVKLINPKLTLEDSAAGSLTFTMPPGNAGYESMTRMASEIRVLEDGEEIWSGRIISEQVDFYKRRNVTCEGELAYLNDTSQPPAEYHDITPGEFLEKLIENHNKKVTANKRFTVGRVTVTDNNDSMLRYTNYESTLECINEKLVKKLGGHLLVRKENGIRYLDYFDNYVEDSAQTIEFGKNLLDFTKTWDMSELATVILPRGNILDDSPIDALYAYLTVESVNSGSPYVVSETAMNTYGWIEKVVDWPDVSEASNLLRKAQTYLSDNQFDTMELELSAVDLHTLSRSIDTIRLLDRVRCISRPHGMDRYFPVRKLVITLDDPKNQTFTLGDKVSVSLTSANNTAQSNIINRIEELPTKKSIIREASDLINNATSGYVTIVQEEGKAQEFIISDNSDYTKAIKLWRWNLNGLGYSKDGGKNYGLAMTMDGNIVANYITTGILRDLYGNVEFNLDTGDLTMKKGSINIANKFSVTTSGYLKATYGQIAGFDITTNSISNGVVTLNSYGTSFIKNGTNIGSIGTVALSGYPNKIGLAFNLENAGADISFNSKDSAEGTFYMKLFYSSKNNGLPGYTPNQWYFGCSVDFGNFPMKYARIDTDTGGAVNGVSGTYNVGGYSMTFKNGMLIA